MTPAQYNEYQRMADVIDEAKKWKEKEKLTAVEYLFETLWDCPKDKLTWYTILEKAKEMEKQLMQDFGARCCLMTKQKNEWTLEKLYNDLYGSKGSDETKTN